MYAPAQTTQTQNIQPGLFINTLHLNTLKYHITSRSLSRSPLQTIPSNPLSYSRTRKNLHNTQHSSTVTDQRNNIHPFSTSHPYSTSKTTTQKTRSQTSNLAHASIETNPHINTTYTQPFTNTQTIQPNYSITPAYITGPPSTIPQSTVSNPTYLYSSTSIFEPIKPFDGLDQNFTPEEYLQHTEARVTFSIGLQPTSDNEYKVLHVRRMAFIECSLTGTALSWYIHLQDTYKQDWHAFVQAFKKQFSSQKNAYYAQVETLNRVKKDNETVRHFVLKIQQLVEKGGCK